MTTINDTTYDTYETSTLLKKERDVLIDSKDDGDKAPPSFQLKLARGMITGGFCILVLMILAIGVAIIIHFGVQAAISAGVHDAKVLLPGSQAFDAWKTNRDQPFSQYETVIMWNMTNPDAVLKGAKPNYEQVGDIVYKKVWERVDLEIARNNNTIRFYQKDHYYFEPSMSSIKDPKSVRITNINPAYMAVMQQTGGEENLRMAMIGPAIKKIIDTMTMSLPDNVYYIFGTQVLVKEKIEENPFLAAKNATGENMELFCQNWANSNFKPNNLWPEAMLVSEGNGTTPSDISFESCKKLWSGEAFSFNDARPIGESGFDAQDWAKAKFGDVALQQKLMTKFDITFRQLSMLWEWVDRFGPTYTWKLAQELYKFAPPKAILPSQLTPDQIGLMQWSQGNGVPLFRSSVDPEHKLPGIPELFYWADSFHPEYHPLITFSIPQVQKLMPLFDTEPLIKFLLQAESGEFEAIQQKWGLSAKQAMILAEYFIYIRENFVEATFKNDILGAGLGPITTKTVDEWLMNDEDPLMVLLDKADQADAFTLFKNLTTIEKVKKFKPGKSMISTGNDEISWVGEYLMDNGTEQVQWRTKVPIRGTDGSQFPPYLKEKDVIYIWFPTVLRPQNFSRNSTTSHKGITTWRFYLQPWMARPNPTFYNGVGGCANMTSVYGAPLFICKWNFKDAQDHWKNAVGGMKPDPTPFDDDTFIDVEPTTGLTMYEQKRIQPSIWFPANSSWLSYYHPDMKDDLLFPLAMINENAEIDSGSAKDFHKRVVVPMILRDVFYWLSVALAILFFIIGGLVSCGGFAMKNKALKEAGNE